MSLTDILERVNKFDSRDHKLFYSQVRACQSLGSTWARAVLQTWSDWGFIS